MQPKIMKRATRRLARRGLGHLEIRHGYFGYYAYDPRLCESVTRYRARTTRVVRELVTGRAA